MQNNFNTGCPNKHGNSVTASISSFQIILWFSIVIPTEKAVICKSFVCYVQCSHFVCLCFDCIRLYSVLSKTRKLQYTNRVNLSVFTVHLADIIILWLLKLGIKMLIHNKDDIEFVTEFPCFFGTPCTYRL